MPHIHTQPGQHDHTASAFVFRIDFDEPKVMLHIHKKIGKYLQLGGHIELNETPWQAIAHELREESGYEMNQLKILQPVDRPRQLSDAVIHPQPVSHSTHSFGSTTDHFHTDVAYAFVANEPPRYAPESGESTNISLFTRNELKRLPNDAIIGNVRELALYIFDTCLEKWRPIATDAFN
jgi:ADP-ribose pyrophosphatase YjhB (NUDIX family)